LPFVANAARAIIAHYFIPLDQWIFPLVIADAALFPGENIDLGRLIEIDQSEAGRRVNIVMAPIAHRQTL